MALFCDFENVALGVRDANYEKFDIKLVLERLLLKGSIVVKKAYCDWERYKGFKATMHEANFELIEIPTCASPARIRPTSALSGRPRPVLHQEPRQYLRHHQRRFRLFAAGLQAARKRQAGDRRRGEAIHLRPAHRQLRRVHLLRRPGARDPPGAARREPREAQAQPAQPRRGKRREELDARRTRAVRSPSRPSTR
jgi:hypothetical protein